MKLYSNITLNIEITHRLKSFLFLTEYNMCFCIKLSDAPPSGSRPTPSQSRPGFMEKESLIYGGHSSNEFPMSPIPISEFPEPPPAYTEVAPPKPTTIPQSPTPTPEPPRTQVILPSPGIFFYLSFIDL